MEIRITAPTTTPYLNWQSHDADGSLWYSGQYSLPDLELITSNDEAVSTTLKSLLLACRQQRPDFLYTEQNVEVQTFLEFPRLWGLGSSSTLIYLLAQWSQTNPYQVLEATMGGSGYDIACAGAKGPILYQRPAGIPKVQDCAFDPPFKDQLYFVYLDRKQNSREGIRHYRDKANNRDQLIQAISTLNQVILDCTNLEDFQQLLQQHEKLLSENLQLPPVQERYFDNFPGVIKSLGAWGGDFVLAATSMSEEKARKYFAERGFTVFLPYREMIGVS